MSPSTPERALAEARRRTEAALARGEYAEAERVAAVGPKPRSLVEKLEEWAFIEVDPKVMVSTRRYGRPITAFKRVLAHVMRQYHADQQAQQTRFNLHLLMHVQQLETRLALLEHRLERDRD